MIEFRYDKPPSKISRVLGDYGLNYNAVMKLLRKKDIKVNDKRINSDILLQTGDNIIVYSAANTNTGARVMPDIVYSDDNIIIVNKRAGIESAGQGSLEELLIDCGYPCKAVHRLDRNTCGLIIYALNDYAKEALEYAFKHRQIRKIYTAEVVGHPKTDGKTMSAYLKKDADTATCRVSATGGNGYVIIKTAYKVIKRLEHSALLEIELFTGRTHQIRAHMAFEGYPVVGDGKYGDYGYNKQHNAKAQRLCATRLIFAADKGLLAYLNGKEFAAEYPQY